MNRKIVKKERRYLLASIHLFNKTKIPYLSTNYLFITNVSGAEMRHRNDKYISQQSTPQVNKSKPTNTKSTLNKKIIFKDSAALLPHSSSHILLHHIAPDRTSNLSNSTSKQGTSNRILKYALLPYPSQRTITTQPQWVRRPMR